MKRAAALLAAVLAAVLVGAVFLGAATASADQATCEEQELAERYAVEGIPNWTEEQKAAAIKDAGASCWAEVKVEEEDAARRQATVERIEQREAERKAEREAEHEREHREEAARIRWTRHHICMEDPGTGRCVIRPHSMLYGAHASIYGIHWLAWGPHRALGIGHILWRHTVTEPHFGPYRAKLVLSLPGECEGRTWYSQRTLTIKRNDVVERDEASGPCAI